MPLLSLIIALPLFGVLAIALLRNAQSAQKLALVVAGIELLATLLAVMRFNADDGAFQLVERYAWIPSLNIDYLVGIDGLSVLFLPMTALLTLMAVGGAGGCSTQPFSRLKFALLLLLESCSMGIFTALDLVLFFMFWELTLPAIFFLAGLWGVGPQRRSAANKYTMLMLFGGVPLLLAIIALACNHALQTGGKVPHDISFSLPMLLKTPLPDALQGVVFLLFLLGFAVKAPLVPFHTWLPQLAMEGTAPLVALLTGLKIGVYGIVRYALPLAPTAAVEFVWVLGVLGAAGLIYGALIALRQTNLRRLLAYASISHVGLVVIGIASLNMQGIQGAIFQLLNFTLVAGSLMLIAGFIQQRLGSTELIHLGGLAHVMPRMTSCYLLFALASFGVPGTNGFPAELLLVVGALLAQPSLGVTALAGAVLGATYMLSFTRRAFFGPVACKDAHRLADLQYREAILLILPALLVLLLGWFPNGVLDINQRAAEVWLSRLLEQPDIGMGRNSG